MHLQEPPLIVDNGKTTKNRRTPWTIDETACIGFCVCWTVFSNINCQHKAAMYTWDQQLTEAHFREPPPNQGDWNTMNRKTQGNTCIGRNEMNY